MPKNVIFCADGTWSGPPPRSSEIDASDTEEDAAAPVTNVVKLFANLAGSVTPESQNLRNEQEKFLLQANGATTQVAKYIHGVGDSTNPIRHVVGGAFGAGVIARVVRGYTFISRHYAQGDNIVLLGFSRGAYTARTLAGMIARIGLLNRDTYDVNDTEKASVSALPPGRNTGVSPLSSANRLTQLTNSVLDLVQQLHARPLPANGLKPIDKIKVVAVWDTVGSLGVPLYDLAHERVDVFQFVDTALSPKVEFGFHAMSIDELRSDFPVTEWTPRAGVEQVWFAGAHADVGGGYPSSESRLSDEALGWMMRKLDDKGVQFAKPVPFPPQHALGTERVHEPWHEVPFLARSRKPREVSAQGTLHGSVVTRLSKTPEYAPDSMKMARAQQAIGSFAVDNATW